MAPKDKQDQDQPLEAGAEQVAERLEADQTQGFRGTKADPTPNDHYTVAGVTSGKPTPETDAKAAAEADRALRGLAE